MSNFHTSLTYLFRCTRNCPFYCTSCKIFPASSFSWMPMILGVGIYNVSTMASNASIITPLIKVMSSAGWETTCLSVNSSVMNHRLPWDASDRPNTSTCKTTAVDPNLFFKGYLDKAVNYLPIISSFCYFAMASNV